MRGSDKLLAGIVTGIVLAVLASLLVAVIRPADDDVSEETPVGVVYNYLYAVQTMAYERAYGYLSPSIECYPSSVEEFADELWWWGHPSRLTTKSWGARQRTVTGERATVSVSEVDVGGGSLFESGPSLDEFDVDLWWVDGRWTIVGMERYYGKEWLYGCR